MSKNKKYSPLALSLSKGSPFFYWLPALIYMGFIFIMSSFPAPEPIRKVPIIYDIKIVHIIEYGILSLLYSYALRKTTTLSSAHILWTAVGLTVAYGITDELHQYFVPGRSCKFTDVLGDLLGALLFQWLYSKVQKQYQLKQTR